MGAYVDSSLLGSGVVSHAAILSNGDGSIWAKDDAFKLSATETKDIAGGFADTHKLFGSGLRVAGEKYTVIRASDEHIHGKRGASGVICSRSNQAIVVATYSNDTKPEPVNTVVESLTDYLRQNNL